MGQLFPSEYDCFGCVFGPLKGVGDNKGNSVSNVAHFISRQDGIWRYINLGVWQVNGAGQRGEIGCLAPGEHKAHPRHRPRLCGIDLKPRMRVGRTHDHCMQHLARRKISNIAP